MRFALELVAIVVIIPIAIWVNYYIFGQYALIDNGLLTPQQTDWSTALVLLNEQWSWIIGMLVTSFVITGTMYNYL